MPVMRKSAKDDYMVTAFGDSANKTVTSDLGFLKLDLLTIVELAKHAYMEELVGACTASTSTSTSCRRWRIPTTSTQRR
jgi:hypothetical protein